MVLQERDIPPILGSASLGNIIIFKVVNSYPEEVVRAACFIKSDYLLHYRKAG